MEFKDKLKKLREEKKISQQKLADEIFVSRSAIAKWENGLGLPSEESMNALIKYFGVDRKYFETEEAEIIIVEKNKNIQKLEIIFGIVFCVITVFSIWVTMAMASGNFGFTSKMAAGEFSDNSCIHTKDYDFYYGSAWEEEYECMDYFKPVKKCLIGYTVSEADYKYKNIYFEDGTLMGIIYTIKGKDCYYNIIKRDMYGPINLDKIEFEENADGSVSTTIPITFPNDLLLYDTVSVNGKEYPVQVNSFFITKEKFNKFSIEGYSFIIEDK